MTLTDLSDCIAQLGHVLDQRGLEPGGLAHAVEQLQRAAALERSGFLVELESRIRATVVTPGGQQIDVRRDIDVLARDLISQLHTEVKTGRLASSVFDPDQLRNDALIALSPALTGFREGLRNIWQTTNLVFDDTTQELLQSRVTALRTELIDTLKFPAEAVDKMLQNFEFSFRRQIDEKSGDILEEPVRLIIGEGGILERAALKESQGSPDFGPAMEEVLGPDGNLAKAAAAAASGVDLAPALHEFEGNVEAGVSGALEEAGAAAEAKAAALGESLAGGGRALGNLLTSVPELVGSVERLGEAWNKPLDSTEAYMGLMTALGGVVNQGVETIEALAGVTKIASAAQAVFNAIMALNPIVLVVIAVVALIAAIVALIVYWDEVKAALRDNPWLAVIAVLFGVIGVIVLIIAYWDEIKLAILRAANFVSIQVQRIGAFFVGLGTLIGQVWDWIVASLANVGIGMMNTFITLGGSIQNFFIGIINWILERYNDLADSVVGDVLGLEKAELLPEVDIRANLIPPREVPEINVAAAFDTSAITGGLEDQIAAQEQVVAAAQREDEERRRAQAAQQPPAAAAAPAAPTAAVGPGAAPLARPQLPPGAAGPAAGGGVHVEGGITVNISAERLEAGAAEILSEEIIRAIRERLDALRSEEGFRTGTRTPAAV